ncbi:hypothetical protein HanRHA438_Chr02g0054671 [Helianthus annuus]|uniref:Uncharacterized protein n=1 Tax=Helianthus annuus TaxID=4232 RepID=A0A9K3JLP8_HELAN|nr:hypothetical protein HanXRQr2_Chr02g0053331 [Helianthus annuus]KAJ0614251.1 hypothetical protein HanIR_Chr02g0060301 [Helianthus annuus]KAJ0938877.1 hypothetical protein HanRHA438_Chr02g0054671 [Helianthus annuus]
MVTSEMKLPFFLDDAKLLSSNFMNIISCLADWAFFLDHNCLNQALHPIFKGLHYSSSSSYKLIKFELEPGRVLAQLVYNPTFNPYP